MRFCAAVVLLTVWILPAVVSLECRELTQSPKAGMMYAMKYKLLRMWYSMKMRLLGHNSFLGRCFGVAKGLRVAMPLIIFKLGVIVTIVSFLTIFSLKGLGLLVTLLMINFSGFFAKLAIHKGGEEKHTPHNLYVHVHNKGGHSPSGLGHYMYEDGWSRRNSIPVDHTSDLDRMELNNLYRRLGINRYSSYNSDIMP